MIYDITVNGKHTNYTMAPILCLKFYEVTCKYGLEYKEHGNAFLLNKFLLISEGEGER